MATLYTCNYGKCKDTVDWATYSLYVLHLLCVPTSCVNEHIFICFETGIILIVWFNMTRQIIHLSLALWMPSSLWIQYVRWKSIKRNLQQHRCKHSGSSAHLTHFIECLSIKPKKWKTLVWTYHCDT
jgi:hypothetical protein